MSRLTLDVLYIQRLVDSMTSSMTTFGKQIKYFKTSFM